MNIEYNKNYNNDIHKMNTIINFFENYKSFLNKKTYKIFQAYIPKLLEMIDNLEEEIKKENDIFLKNDSDNEENYEDEYKNSEDVDSISEYDTDTDDEYTKEHRKKLVVRTTKIKYEYEKLLKNCPIKFNKK